MRRRLSTLRAISYYWILCWVARHDQTVTEQDIVDAGWERHAGLLRARRPKQEET